MANPLSLGEKMNRSIIKYFAGTLVFMFSISSVGVALASEKLNTNSGGILNQCEYLPLATNLAFPKKFGKKNTSVCVDIPVKLERAKIVFNMDTPAVDKKGNANGLKHMAMMGAVMKQQIKLGLIKPENVSIIGVVHGSALKWVTKASTQKKWINAIFKLESEGVNIHLEACAAAMNGAGLTKKNLYSYTAKGDPDPKAGGRIYVNQGAFGRELYLQNQGYAYAEEGNDHSGK